MGQKKNCIARDAVLIFSNLYRLIPVPVTISVTSTTTVVAAWCTFAFNARTSYRNGECTSVVFCIVEFFNGTLSFFIVGHLYKAVPF